MAKNDFQYGGWNSYILQCGTIMTLISPCDCTLQCDMWLWDDMLLNSPANVTAWLHLVTTPSSHKQLAKQLSTE